jgi:hypothetical protein
MADIMAVPPSSETSSLLVESAQSSQAINASSADSIPVALKARFKKRAAATGEVFQNWQIRVHRSLSWLKRAAEFRDDQPEAQFLYLWISLNSLYSRWNATTNQPDADGASRAAFLRQICEVDKRAFADLLKRSRGLARKLLQNPYLSATFWRDPENPKAKGWATQDASFYDRNLKEGHVCRVLEQAVDRLFVLRGQIVHGASTGGSRLNRSSLNYALKFLQVFVPLVVQVVIDNGANDEWPDLCYQPVR